MLPAELEHLVEDVVDKKCERQNIELKRASFGTPEKLYDTLSSFSNQNGGGIILFGIDEKNDFEITGVYDAQDLQTQVTNQALQMEPVVRPVFTVAQVAGKTVVVAGYGWCGKGIAMRAKGMGANVIVTEVDPFKALEATMENFRVMPMDEAAKYGDIFVTATGCKDVIVKRHFEVMKDNVLLCNSGHFDCEVDVAALKGMATEHFPRREGIEGYKMKDGRTLNVLAEGRLVNLAAGNGHPAEIMDMSFAVQALSLEWMAKHAKDLEKKVYNVPDEIDDQIGRVKLAAMGLSIDTLTQEQKDYLAGWEA